MRGSTAFDLRAVPFPRAGMVHGWDHARDICLKAKRRVDLANETPKSGLE